MEMEIPPPPSPVLGVKRRINKKCPHGRHQSICKDCGGASICAHGRQGHQCRNCLDMLGKKRKQYIKKKCPHGKRKNRCKDCGGKGVCPHDRLKDQCKDCLGILGKKMRIQKKCLHGRQKYHCKDCLNALGRKPKQYKKICPHGRIQRQCRECYGSKICPHAKQQHTCKECNNFICEIADCPLKGNKFAGARSLQNHMRTQHGDNPKALTKTTELDLHQSLQTAGIEFEYQYHLPFKSCGLESETACAYIDFAILTVWGVILLEVDEFQHAAYDPSCDVRRDFDSCASIALGSQQKAVVLRYNPDAFKIGGKTRFTTKKKRQAKLIETIKSWQNDPAPELGFARFFLFYDAEDDSSPLPAIAQHWPEEVKAVSRRLA